VPEAVASIGKAFYKGEIPVKKTLTLVKKDGDKKLISARIGTPMSGYIQRLRCFLK